MNDEYGVLDDGHLSQNQTLTQAEKLESEHRLEAARTGLQWSQGQEERIRRLLSAMDAHFERLEALAARPSGSRSRAEDPRPPAP